MRFELNFDVDACETIIPKSKNQLALFTCNCA